MQSRRVLLILSAFSCLLQISCAHPPPDPGISNADGLEIPSPDRGIQLGLKVKVDAGAEVVVCRELVLPGDTAIEVGRIEHASSTGTHHVHAYRTSTPPDKVSPEPFSCGDLAGPLFYTAEKEEDSTHFQPGIGVKFARGEVVRLELHYLDTGSAGTEPDLRVNLWFADKPLIAEAGSFSMYDHDLAVPPHGSAKARMHCEIPADISITSLLPHLHAHGTGERITLGGPGLVKPQLLVDSHGYGDLETRSFDAAPILVKAGQALDFECDFQNGSDEALVEGMSPTTAEMCALLGSYYPRLPTEAEWCKLPGSGPVP